MRISRPATAFTVFALIAAGATPALAQIAPHRAVYDLKLKRADETSGLNDLRGRLVFELLGSTCEGYSLNTRYVFRSEADGGISVVSDVRAAQWEDAAGESFRFVSQRYDNDQLSEETDGFAERVEGAVEVTIDKPDEDVISFKEPVLFPTQHLIELITAAENGDRLLSARVFDGSEHGDTMYSTLSVIGEEMAPGAPDPNVVGDVELADMPSWRVTISYFEERFVPDDDSAGEQTPIYTIGFDMFSNGVSRALNLDYGNFELSGALTEFELLPETDCQ